MLKKLSFVLSLPLVFSFLFTGSLFAQVKTTTSKTTTSVKQNTVVKKSPAISAIDTAIRVKITTDSGVIIVKLYDSTPMHRDNFVKLVKQGFYDSLMFHRVIPGFMIQGGDPESKNAQAGTTLGNGGSNMARIPAEFRQGLIHKKGALAAARDNNPQKASSACQFYIVDGTIADDNMLTAFEQRKGMKYTAAQRNMYTTIGGTPSLDQEYTVFGEVESGLDVISKIANVQKDGNNRPSGDIRMHMELIK